MAKLVIVESPTKAKTISKFLGRDYKIESSYGHIRDLPKSKMGIDIEHDFQPEYVIPKDAKKRVAELKSLAKEASEVILATDEDREGEAISWHLVEALGLAKARPDASKPKRIVFHEITKSAIESALKNPRTIDLNLVDAQQARRILDRLVGYELSPFLWRKVKMGLSAGRVQSVALRLIVEREREIEKFKPEEYWTIEALLAQAGSDQKFVAKLHKIGQDTVKKFDIETAAAADRIVSDLKGATYKVEDIQEKETKRYPSPPFITSTLQQEAARKLGMSAKQTMMHAQRLYETGYITYMRTDSVNLAEAAIAQAKAVITEKYGPNYSNPRRYKTKAKGAQEAHEAIRPTDLSQDARIIEGTLEKRQAQLYDLIWKRALASQMVEAIFDQTTADISAFPPLARGGIKGEVERMPEQPLSNSPLARGEGKNTYTFRATGQVMKFDGFIKVYMEGRDEETEDELPEGQLPKLTLQEQLDLHDLAGKQHFTIPLPRYTDATLVKALEEFGIGRPSTYAPTISTILERGYVEQLEKKFHPTDIGIVVNDLLVEHFPHIVDFKFTADMEEDLDEIAEGKLQWVPVIREFYTPFKANLKEKEKTVEKQVTISKTPCPHCGEMMLIKFGRYGQFLACPQEGSKVTLPLPEEAAKIKALEEKTEGEQCPLCGKAMEIKRGRFGYFLGCVDYPECKGIKKIETKTGFKCPNCASTVSASAQGGEQGQTTGSALIGDIVEKKSRGRGKIFYACNRFPACNFLTGKKPESQEELMQLFEAWKNNPPKPRKSFRKKKSPKD